MSSIKHKIKKLAKTGFTFWHFLIINELKSPPRSTLFRNISEHSVLHSDGSSASWLTHLTQPRPGVGWYNHGVRAPSFLDSIQLWASSWVLFFLSISSLALATWRFLLQLFPLQVVLLFSMVCATIFQTSRTALLLAPCSSFWILSSGSSKDSAWLLLSKPVSITDLLGFTSASIVFKKRFSSVFALTSISSTGGIAAGPPLGGLLYEFFGYPGPFLILGACVLLYGAVITPWVGFQFEGMMEAGEEKEEHSDHMITYKDFLKHGVSLSQLSKSSFHW